MKESEDTILNAKQVVEMIPGWTLEALYASRTRGDGPRGYRVGRRLMFKRSDIYKWLATKAEQKAKQPA